MLLREIRVVSILPKTQISISGANFSVVETEADCFQQNRPKAAPGQPEQLKALLIIATKRDGRSYAIGGLNECKLLVRAPSLLRLLTGQGTQVPIA